MNPFETVAIIGAGSWGTALSGIVAPQTSRVLLWGHDTGRIARLRETRINETYLPQLRLQDNVEPTADLTQAASADALLLVTPSKAVREIAARLASSPVRPGAPVISCTKGLERGSGKRMSAVLAELLPRNPVGVLSGPSHAEEVATNMPTAVVLGCTETALNESLQQLFNGPFFRTYTSPDVAGIELGGALKNIFAIAAGVCDGLGLGDNSKAALVTRALAEMIRLGEKLGGRQETFQGLSGIGDLMVTCFSPHSRNRRVGEMLGKGRALDEIIASMTMVAEGVPTTLSAHEQIQATGARAPITEQVYALLYENRPPREAMMELLSRDPRPEAD